MKKVLTCLFFALFSSVSFAQVVWSKGSDFGSSWDNTNNGTGWAGGWTFSPSGTAGSFLAGTSNSDCAILESNKAFGLWANANGVSSVVREFSSNLAANQDFQIEMDNGNVNSGATVGFGLQTVSNSNVVEFYFRGGQSNYDYNIQGTQTATSVGWSNSGLRIKVGLRSATTCRIVIESLNGSVLQTIDNITISNTIKKVRLFSAGGTSGTGGDLFFNQVRVVDDNVLSAELTHFTAVPQANSVLLSWTTASETNNSHFEVERSTDARTWAKVGEVKGNGSKSAESKYTFTDAQPTTGINYYRLKQVDTDGKFAYHKVVSVVMGKGSKVSIAPNPAHEQLQILGATEGGEASIFNVSGQLLMTVKNTTTLNISALPSGVYQLRYQSENGETTLSRFVKQ